MRKLVDPIYDFFTGRCVRRIKCKGHEENAVYLTFDDGPSPLCTPKVLELLKKHEAPSTFFVIGKRAQENPDLIKKTQESGHTIGNHTIDHDTSHYFSLNAGIEAWLNSSHKLLENELGINSIGFRSPIGIKTPSLNMVLRKKKWPLLLWDVRFYDTKYGLSKSAVEKKLSHLQSGSIILLHDTHLNQRQDEFLASLEFLIVEAKKRGFHFKALTKELIDHSYLEKYKSF